MTLRNSRQISEICKQGRLAEALPSISTDLWPSLIDKACLGKNVEAVKTIILSGVEVVPFHFTRAIYCENLEILETLILFRPDFNQRRFLDTAGYKIYCLIDTTLLNHIRVRTSCIKLMIANGARLNSNKKLFDSSLIPDGFWTFQAGVIACRDVIVILLGLKKRKQILHKLDKFLVLQELAVAIWATRHSM